MKTHLITKDQIDSDGNYIGNTDLTNFQGHIEIAENLGTVKFAKSLVSSGGIYAKAGTGIEAGWGIKAGWGIEAGEGIEAGTGIKAGWGISCKLTLSIGLRIFAGLCLWRLPTAEEKKITCGKLEKGDVCYGELVETGLPTLEKNLVLSSVILTESDIEALKNALQ